MINIGGITFNVYAEVTGVIICTHAGIHSQFSARELNVNVTYVFM